MISLYQIKKFTLIGLLIIGNNTMANIDDKVRDVVKKYNIPSLSVMVLSQEKILVQSSFGVRKSGEDDKIKETDSFHLGSCGKAFTATLILKLQDEGKLSVEDSITKYLKTLDAKKFADIKIKHLLSHTGGIKANVEGGPWGSMFSFDITPSQGRDIAINFLNTAKRTAKAGSEFIYSNIGYMLLGQIIEKVESRPFEEVLTTKLFKPFEMNSCSYGPAGRNDNSSQPWAHQFVDGKYIPQDPKLIGSDNPPALSPAGGISCGQGDWAKFIWFVMNVGKNSKYLSPEGRAFISKVNLDDYTFGAWGKVSRDWSGILLIHAGSNTLNYSYAIVGLDKKFAFLINTNSPSQEAVLEMVPFLKEYYINSLQ
ncbi:serine hydrolase [Bacteriovorax sp. Seq25_V]|uniref:serine hydrolase domain-containing protein n=1 Tax=Bacteriovorax sp. Seq25_V TaxID=1201288 RepID=UPI00038A2481|nr:serine hydrolase domain-containing protein [Bacteriovorax sp. Seq25_V]EQC44030.1 beta-lactamase [Bacteriovorax sp. Seq25_V]